MWLGWPGRMGFQAGVRGLAGALLWIPTTRAQQSRVGLRHGSDVTDAEWLILAPFLPPPSRCCRHRKWEMREVVNAVFYILRGGVVWSLLQKDFPPKTFRHGRRLIAGLRGSATTAPGSGSTIIS